MILLLAYGFRTDPKAIPSPLVQKAAPDFRLKVFGGGEISLAELKGKAVIVNFWASWCYPACYEEAPLLESTWRRYKEQGLMVVGVDIQDKEANALEFMLAASLADLAEWREEPGAVHLRLEGARGALDGLFEARTVTTGCGKGTTFFRTLDALQCRRVESRVRFEAGAVLPRMVELQRRSDLYRETGGTHNAGLAEGGKILCFRTDIGRHNAVDMLGGWALLAGIDVGGTLLLTTGRVSSEILVKAVRMGVPVLVSRSAPTALALGLARDLAITVIGYARGGGFNIYTHPVRVEASGTHPDEPGGADE